MRGRGGMENYADPLSCFYVSSPPPLIFCLVRRLRSIAVSYCIHVDGTDLLLFLLLLVLLLAGTRFINPQSPAFKQWDFGTNMCSHLFKCTMQSAMLCFSKKHTFNLYSFCQIQILVDIDDEVCNIDFGCCLCGANSGHPKKQTAAWTRYTREIIFWFLPFSKEDTRFILVYAANISVILVFATDILRAKLPLLGVISAADMSMNRVSSFENGRNQKIISY